MEIDRATARKLVWALAATGAVFAPMAMTGALVLMVYEDIGVALLGLVLFMLVPAALLGLAFHWILSRPGPLAGRRLAMLVLWQMAAALLLCAAGFIAGVAIVLIMMPLPALDMETAASFVAIIAAMGLIGAIAALCMRFAWAGRASLRGSQAARAQSWRTLWIGAAIAAAATALFPLGFVASDFSPIFMVALVGAAAGVWMGLVGRAALADVGANGGANAAADGDAGRHAPTT